MTALWRYSLLLVSCVSTCVITTPHVVAQPVPTRDPASTHIFPAGGRRGTVVPVRVGGECLPPGSKLRVWGRGVTATPTLGPKVTARYHPAPRRAPNEIPISYPKEWSGEVRIGTDALPGTVMWWRLTCAQGGSGARPFVIGDLPEFIETEENSKLEFAERTTLPVTLNGQICEERDLDYYIFSAEMGQTVVCEVLAGRLGSALNPIVELLDKQGNPLAVGEVAVGTDPVLAFRVPATDDYVLLVSNLSYYGSPKHVYRINLSTLPYAIAAFPAGGRVGDRREVTFYTLSGYPSGTGVPQLVKDTVTFTESHLRNGTGDFLYRGWGTETNTKRIAGMNSLELVAGTLPDIIGNDAATAESPMTLMLPVTVNGQFLDSDDDDWYAFEAQKGQPYSLVCRPIPSGLATLPTVSILNEAGEVLAESKSVDSAARECRLEWTAPSTDTYRLWVRDIQFGITGGPSFVYRLTVRAAEPDFHLHLASDFLNVVQEGASELTVTVDRRGEFNSAIDISVSGLPAHVTAAHAQIAAGQNSVKLAVKAGKDARPGDAMLRVSGRATIDARVVERFAVAPHWGIDADGVSAGVPVVDHLHLTVRHKPVFRLFCSEAYRYAHRGSVYPYDMELERIDGYDGEIVLQIGDRQNRDLDGIEMFETTVPPTAEAAIMPIYLPETMHINIQSQSQLYVQAYTVFTDRWGEKQSLLVVSEKRCLIRTRPTVAKLQPATQETVVVPGATTVYGELLLDRTSNFQGPLDLKLIDGPRGFVAEPVHFEAGGVTAVARIDFDRTATRPDHVRLKFRGTGMIPNGHQLITEATLVLRFAEQKEPRVAAVK